ncbi:MAG: bifunctional 2-C-methyl-D-erythritol 4-phosphate cytidylyltransferase/2-C-methyl-D-erythritol 2,4-cyclodiphosphate synthase [Alphaproteobacteria bacterium]|nr:bifunctional 2-C-methyl-D-erythritol 4-phosphate cytidylyltransferase/2-C-methyl-D-erythritol 2,4-cyclodiphosphate synthase [Alphaproteobacteria bacterium]
MAGTFALILAGGRGTRLGGDIPKQYLDVGGIPVLRRSLEAFVAHPRIDAVGTVIHRDDTARYAAAAEGLDLLAPVFGGELRRESSCNGLNYIKELHPERVLVHDAARPFVDAATIDRVLDALDDSPAAIAAVPVTDTIKRSDARDKIAGTVDRTHLWRAQTPQGFRYADILAAYDSTSDQDLTDDAAVAEAAGLDVALVLGGEDNIKITTDGDLARAERIARRSDAGDARVGMGFDVHRFEPGNAVVLCGIEIPHTAKLKGHSDADVGLHAITDAVLGAIGDGDIGDHFPPRDPRWRDAPSHLFLADAAARVRDRGGEIRHLDVTLICEQPKIGPHRRAMREKIAEICGIKADSVSVKATTTEQLGFTGRGEGIAAQAVATVRL